MNDAGPSRQPAEDERRAISEDLAMLAVLHDREADAQTLERLRKEPFEAWLGLRLLSSESRAALDFMDQALAELPDVVDEAVLDRLAVEYARIYLNHHYSASPEESVWLTVENIVRQEPMFEVRAAYRRHGLEAEDWRRRPDDHLVMQLLFLSHLFAKVAGNDALIDAARFLDRHTLVWIRDFAGALAARAEQKFYVGLALTTACYVDELRNYLVDVTGEERRDEAFRQEAFRRMKKPDEQAENRPFVPGSAPSW